MRLAITLLLATTLSHSISALDSPSVPRSGDEGLPPAGLPASDLTSIREAYEIARHTAHPVVCGFQARNPGQRWTTTFDRRGFLTEPDSGSWTWGLDLVSYGFSGTERAVTGTAKARAEGGRVVYEWDATLEEWYVNDSRGLEHGYTLHRRPTRDGATGPLGLTLSVRGGLRPAVDLGGRGVRFLDDSGDTVLTYSGLTVFDADGRELSARFEPVAGGLRLSVDERGARYPLTIDPLAQQAYLKASNTDPSDGLGRAVAVHGDTAVIGAQDEDSSATGVDGDQGDNSASRAGAAYVFVRNGLTWSQQAYLKASNTEADDLFGFSVAVYGDRVVVGAIQEDGGSGGVNGDQDDESATYSGAAYVFVRNGATWTQEAYLKAAIPGTSDQFGFSVAMTDERIAVGAIYEDSSASGVNGDQDNDDNPGSGAVYVFKRDALSGWIQEAYIKASNPDQGDEFGWGLAVDGETLVVTSYREASNATGVDGDQRDNSADKAGAAYVFEYTPSGWMQEAYLKASNTDAGDRFGYGDPSVSGDTVLVGAHAEASAATGVNGDEGDDSAPDAGATYVFERSGGSWSQTAYLKASNAQSGDGFGRTVGVAGDWLVVGAPYEDSGAIGVNGDQNDESATYSGAVYVFHRGPAGWGQQVYLKSSNTDEYDRFASALAVSDGTLVVGAPYEDSSASGVNGDQDDNMGSDSGAAYVYDLDALGPGTEYCFGDPGAACPCLNENDGSVPGSGCANGVFASGAKITGSGTPSLGADTLVLHCTGLEPSNSGLYFQGDNDLSPGFAWGDGLRCAGGTLKRLGVRFSDASGYSDTSGYAQPISVKAGNVAAGDTKYYQCWYRNPLNSPCGHDFNASNGYAIAWLP